MKLTVLLAMVLLTGCDLDRPVAKEPDSELRQELFFKCLKALPQPQQATHYSDWDEVVSECGNQAYYLSLKPKAKP